MENIHACWENASPLSQDSSLELDVQIIYNWTMSDDLCSHLRGHATPADPLVESLYRLHLPSPRQDCALVLARETISQRIVGSMLVHMRASRLASLCGEVAMDSSSGGMLSAIVVRPEHSNTSSYTDLRDITQRMSVAALRELDRHGCEMCKASRVCVSGLAELHLFL